MYSGLIIFYIALTTLFYFLGYVDILDSRIRGVDGVYYYVYLPSLFFDMDLDFTNNLKHIYGPQFEPILTPTGLAANQWSIGPAIMWTPFFLLAHATTLIANSFGAQLAANGCSYYYYIFIYVGNSLYGLLGVMLTASFLRTFYSPFPVFTGALSILLVSQLTYYLWSFSAMSHNTSLAATALFLLIWRKKNIQPITAICASLMFLTRWQNLLFVLPLLIKHISDLISLIKQSTEYIQKTNHFFCSMKKIILFAVVFLLGVSPQCVSWWILYGTPIAYPKGNDFHGAHFIDLGRLKVYEVLFSTDHGLFSWHPFLFLGFLGLLLCFKKQKTLILSFLGCFALQIVLISGLTTYNAGWSFGHRMFISTLPILAFGISYVTSILKFGGRTVIVLLLMLCTVWNQIFIFQYYHGMIPRSHALNADEYLFDKFRIRALYRARMFNIKAVISLRENSLGFFHIFAKEAYERSPKNWNTDTIFALSCLLQDNRELAEKLFKGWLKRDPNNILPRWAMAELYLRRNQGNKGLDFFKNQTTGLAKQITHDLEEGISKRKKTFVGENFYSSYLQYIENHVIEKD